MEVFARLHNVDKSQLVTSTDAFGFFLPEYKMQPPYGSAKKQPTTAAKLRRLANLHVDTVYTQNCLDRDYVQSFVNVMETKAGQATFVFIPESHKLHFKLAERFPEKTNTRAKFNILNPPELDWYMLEQKKRVEALILPAGCMVLFYSRTVHCGMKPMVAAIEQEIRLTFYVCQVPLTQRWITDRELKRKITYLRQGRTTSHQPADFQIFKPYHTGRNSVTQNIVYPQFDWTTLTDVQKRLAGLEPNGKARYIH
jgi:hypothetical protein